MKKITKAVFPVAGLGSRFLPVTKASPKEMLPVVDKPLIQYAVEEAYAAGIREMIFVTGRNKRAIEDHFDTAYELEAELEAAGKAQSLALLRSIKPEDMECVFVRQPRALGLGHAVLCAENLVRGEPFAVLLADDLMVSPALEKPLLAEMVTRFAQAGQSLIAVQDVPPEHAPRYGIVTGSALPGQPDCYQIDRITEKPQPQEAQRCSDGRLLGVVGRYLFTSKIFTHLRQVQAGALGEIQLTDAIAALLRHETCLAFAHQARRYDCGDKFGLITATIDLALAQAAYRAPLLAHLRGLGA